MDRDLTQIDQEKQFYKFKKRATFDNENKKCVILTNFWFLLCVVALGALALSLKEGVFQRETKNFEVIVDEFKSRLLVTNFLIIMDGLCFSFSFFSLERLI